MEISLINMFSSFKFGLFDYNGNVVAFWNCSSFNQHYISTISPDNRHFNTVKIENVMITVVTIRFREPL